MIDKKISVLIVDDSAFIRQAFAEFLSSDPAIQVAGVAKDPFEAREKIKQLNPDVVTLDIEMPRMDGLAFLEKIMALRPMPVVMVSTLTQKGADATLRALELGAVDYVSKPLEHQGESMEELRGALIEKVKAAARARVRMRPSAIRAIGVSRPEPVEFRPGPASRKLVAIGSSTGGVEALCSLLPKIPAAAPPIVIAQHMPKQFTSSFSRRLDGLSHISVCEAAQGMRLESGHAYVAPGDMHLTVEKEGKRYKTVLSSGEKVSGHRPSVDVLFESVALAAGGEAVGVILTGMGRDGAIGLQKMRYAGARTLGQNEESCVVYGMPKAARLNDAVEEEVSLDDMAARMMRCCS